MSLPVSSWGSGPSRLFWAPARPLVCARRLPPPPLTPPAPAARALFPSLARVRRRPAAESRGAVPAELLFGRPTVPAPPPRPPASPRPGLGPARCGPRGSAELYSARRKPRRGESRAEAGGRGAGDAGRRGRARGGGRGGPCAGEAVAGLGAPGSRPGRSGKAAPARWPRLPLPLHPGEGVPETAPILSPPPASPALASGGAAPLCQTVSTLCKDKEPSTRGRRERRKRRRREGSQRRCEPRVG